MARHPTARRVHREVEAEDVFVARAIEAGGWAKAHGRILLAAAVAVMVLVAGTLYYINNRRTVHAEAEMRLMEIRQTVEVGNPALAMRDLESLLTTFKGTRAADEGRLLLAILHMEQGEPARSVELLERLARDPGAPLGSSAAFLLGAAYEAQGQADRAEAQYLRIGDRARLDYERREALDQAARLRLERGDAAGAAQLYARLVEMTPTSSPDRAVYEMRRSEALAAAEAPPVAPAATPAPAAGGGN